MRKFDTKIQYLKYKVLREVARYGFEDNLDAAYYEIPKLIVKEKPTMRCCIYKERAIVEERIKLAMGGDKKNPNVIEVIEIACDECPVSGHVVTESCRGCLAHRCEDVCRRGAITFDEQQKAHIDTPQHCQAQGGKHRFVGDEVGAGDPYALSRCMDGFDEKQ